MELRRIHQDFSVCQVEDYSLVNFESQYCFIGKTDEEKSLVCATGEAPANAVRWIVDWQFQYFENRYNVIVWDAPAHILFCPEAWYTLHIDAPEWGTEMETEKSICHAICKNISYLVRIYPGYSYFHVNIGMQVSIYTGINPTNGTQLPPGRQMIGNHHDMVCYTFIDFFCR